MTEEKKEEKAQAPTPEPQPAQVPIEAVPPKTETKPETVAVKKERPANCAVCNKSIKKLRWYYRNGKYYCTQRCWKTTLKKTEEAQKIEPAEAK